MITYLAFLLVVGLFSFSFFLLFRFCVSRNLWILSSLFHLLVYFCYSSLLLSYLFLVSNIVSTFISDILFESSFKTHLAKGLSLFVTFFQNQFLVLLIFFLLFFFYSLWLFNIVLFLNTYL